MRIPKLIKRILNIILWRFEEFLYFLQYGLITTGTHELAFGIGLDKTLLLVKGFGVKGPVARVLALFDVLEVLGEELLVWE